MTWRPDDEATPRRIGDLLGGVGRRLGAPEVVAGSAVLSRWDELVGEGVAAHARAVSLRTGTLLVEVDDPAWATQVKLLAGEVTRRIAEVLGDGLVERLEVRVARPRRPSGRG